MRDAGRQHAARARHRTSRSNRARASPIRSATAVTVAGGVRGAQPTTAGTSPESLGVAGNLRRRRARHNFGCHLVPIKISPGHTGNATSLRHRARHGLLGPIAARVR
jgi:hypothetical protein